MGINPVMEAQREDQQADQHEDEQQQHQDEQQRDDGQDRGSPADDLTTAPYSGPVK